MLHPVLTILVASAVQFAGESPRQADLAQIVFEITQAVEARSPEIGAGVPETTVCEIPYYYSDFTPIAPPEVVILVTYDWRSPVVFDLP